MKRIFFLIVCSLVLFVHCLISTVSACSLALHDWKLAFYIKIPVSHPFFPLAEFSLLKANFKIMPADKIIWNSEHDWLSLLLSDLIYALPGWPAKAHWILNNNSQSVLTMARQLSAAGKSPVILESALNYLKIAVFSDANSEYNCHQLVLMTNSRIRGVFTDHSSPWAQEITSMAWLSLIFYQLPFPGRILSLGIFPFNSNRYSIFEDHGFVESLLGKKLLRRRPDLKIDPYVFDFPELPE
jgi:hypothetical protein